MNKTIIGNKTFEVYYRENGKTDIYIDNPYSRSYLIAFATKEEFDKFVHFLNEVKKEVG